MAITTRRELESHVVANAWRDANYKHRLLQDPRGVLQAEIRAIDPDIKLPDSTHVSVHEETAAQMHIVLPRNPREISLSEAAGGNLESIAPQTVAVLVVLLNAVITSTAVNVNLCSSTSTVANVVA